MLLVEILRVSSWLLVNSSKPAQQKTPRFEDKSFGGEAKPVQRPMPYSGDSCWESYFAQFEITAQLNGWSEQQKAAFLATRLKGPALNILSNLPVDRRQDYTALVTALESRYGTAHKSELYRVRFKNRVKQKDESLAALSEDLERLGRLAYPDAPADMQNSLSRDQFVDALLEEDTRLRIKQHRPKTLQHALELALELESFQLASKQRYYRTSRETRIDEQHNKSKVTMGCRNSNAKQNEESSPSVIQLIECLEASMRECLKSVVAAVGSQGKQQNRSRAGCWKCGASGHIRKNCPYQSPSRDRAPNDEVPTRRTNNYEERLTQAGIEELMPASRPTLNAPTFIVKTGKILNLTDSLRVQ